MVGGDVNAIALIAVLAIQKLCIFLKSTYYTYFVIFQPQHKLWTCRFGFVLSLGHGEQEKCMVVHARKSRIINLCKAY